MKKNALQAVLLLAVMVTGCAVLWSGGCRKADPGKPRSGSDADTSDKVQKVEALYQSYLEGDFENANRSMEKIVSIVNGAPELPTRVRAHYLWLAHARLYILNRMSANEGSAEAHWVKTRYWYLIEEETRNHGTAEAGKAVAKFTQSQCAIFVNDWDRKKTGGKGPNFAADWNREWSIPDLKADHAPRTQPTTQPTTSPTCTCGGRGGFCP